MIQPWTQSCSDYKCRSKQTSDDTVANAPATKAYLGSACFGERGAWQWEVDGGGISFCEQ